MSCPAVGQFADALGCFMTEFLGSVQKAIARLPNVVLLGPGGRYHRRQNHTRDQAGDADQPGIYCQLIANRLLARPANPLAVPARLRTALPASRTEAITFLAPPAAS